MEDKKEVLQEFLSQGKIVISVNSKIDGVVLPKHLMDKEQVKLSLSLKFPRPIKFKENKVKTKLSFNGKVEDVVLPYKSIYAVANVDFINSFCWEEDAPEFFLKLAEYFEKELSKKLDKELERLLETEKDKFLDFKKEVKKLKSKS